MNKEAVMDKAMDIAEENYGSDFYELIEDIQQKILQEATEDYELSKIDYWDEYMRDRQYDNTR